MRRWIWGCDYIATGHYAKTSQAADGTWQLHRGEDPKKDQSYILYSLTQERLSRTIFPLAGLDKEHDVRRIAAEQGFANAKKAESEDICFIPDGDYAGYIERRCGHPLRRATLCGATAAWSDATTARCAIPSASARAWASRWPIPCT